MTALPPDPDPAAIPGLEPGGGVPPGSTPPGSAQTSGVSAPEPSARHRVTPAALATLVAVAVLVALFASVAVMLVLKMTGAAG